MHNHILEGVLILSIFGTFFVSIENFINNFIGTFKKDYQSLEPNVKIWFDTAIKLGNAIKTYIATPGSAGPVASELIVIVENLIGPNLMAALNAVINEVLIDLGIIDTALTDPETAWQALLDHLKTFTGSGLGKQILLVVSTLVAKLTGLTDFNTIVGIVGQAYKFFFSSTALAAAPALPAPATPAPVAESEETPAPEEETEQAPQSSTLTDEQNQLGAAGIKSE